MHRCTDLGAIQDVTPGSAGERLRASGKGPATSRRYFGASTDPDSEDPAITVGRNVSDS